MTSTDSSAVVAARRLAAAFNTGANAKRTKAAPPPCKISKGWAKASAGTQKIHVFFGGGRNHANTARPNHWQDYELPPPQEWPGQCVCPKRHSNLLLSTTRGRTPVLEPSTIPSTSTAPFLADDNSQFRPNTGLGSSEITEHNTDIPVATSLDDLVSVGALENDTDHPMKDMQEYDRHQVPATVTSVATSTSDSTPSTYIDASSLEPRRV